MGCSSTSKSLWAEKLKGAWKGEDSNQFYFRIKIKIDQALVPFNVDILPDPYF